MKRDLSNLTESDILKIKLWLAGDPGNCPKILCSTCDELFPKGGPFCPCRDNNYGTAYVTRIAKEIVKEWEAP